MDLPFSAEVLSNIQIESPAAAASAGYALLSPCARRYGYGASQRRVCDESLACYPLGEPAW